MLFVLSIPFWWLFDSANSYLGNWHYVSPRPQGAIEYVLTVSLAFSTVMPAVFVTAELARSLRALAPRPGWVRLELKPATLVTISFAGLVMIVLSLTFPRVAYSLIWIGFFLAVDPINTLLGHPSVSQQVRRGRSDTVLVLYAAGPIFGLIWEFWNVNSMPNWVYDVPFVGRPKLFEMPLLGY